MNKMQIDGLDVYIEGEGAETVVMLGGWPDTYRIWDAQVKAMSGTYRCIRFSLPGFDRGQAVKGYTHQEVSAFIKTVIERLSPNQKVILMLHDWGAVYGYQFYMHNQNMVSRLIGVDVGDIQGEAFKKEVSAAERCMIFLYQAWLAAAWKIGGRIGNVMSRLMALGLKSPSLTRYIDARMAHPYYVMWFGGRDSFDDLAVIDPACPMLYAYGKRKPAQFQTRAWLKALASRPDCRVQAFETGHWVSLEQPQKFNFMVMGWLQATAPEAVRQKTGYDVIIKNGLFFDGTGADIGIRHLGIIDSRVACISREPLDERACPKVIDAEHRWVSPGFLEIHSHYDAEMIVAPALKESVRHGVTTVALGSCSLSMIVADPEDCSDLFTRVESVPREQVLPMLKAQKTWSTPKEYKAFLERHPLGPNVCSFIGHSDIRVKVMGLDRATKKDAPTASELHQMAQLTHDALDVGCVGLSVMSTRLDKLDGERAWSRPLPSTFSSWDEFIALFKVLRQRGAILQGAPDAVSKVNIFGFFWHGIGLIRKPLKMSMLTAMDLKSQPQLHAMTRTSGWIMNRLLGANFRWQSLPAPFNVTTDGIDLAIFEEFSSGELLRDIKTLDEKYEKIKDPAFRKSFKKDIYATWGIGLWSRNFADMWVEDCPDKDLVGKSYEEIGRMQGKDGVDAFFDLALIYREKLRSSSVLANHRPHIMHKLIASPHTQVGFADSGAHVRNLARYNFPLRLLKYVRDAQNSGKPFMSTARGMQRTSGELADWFGLNAGYLRVGDRADVVIVNPEGLTDELDTFTEEPIENLEGIVRVVNRNDAAVEATLINGKVAYERDKGFAQDLGKTKGYGQFLTAATANA